jgi:hypothetical protein
MSSDLQDLLDLVEAAAPGWRMTRTHTGGWQIKPADRTKAVIFAPSRFGDRRSIENFRAELRRSGLPALQPVPKVLPMTTGPRSLAPVAPAAPAGGAPPPRDLILEARTQINLAVNALAALDGLLGEIAAEAESVSKVRALLRELRG